MSHQRFSHFDVTKIIELNACGSYPRNGRGFIQRNERNEKFPGTRLGAVEKQFGFLISLSL